MMADQTVEESNEGVNTIVENEDAVTADGW